MQVLNVALSLLQTSFPFKNKSVTEKFDRQKIYKKQILILNSLLIILINLLRHDTVVTTMPKIYGQQTKMYLVYLPNGAQRNQKGSTQQQLRTITNTKVETPLEHITLDTYYTTQPKQILKEVNKIITTMVLQQ